MYHYVRRLAGSRYPDIKGLELEAFRGQVRYLKRHGYFPSTEEILHSVKTGEALPENSVWLTFDDGLIDHYADVFPVLLEEKVPGAFFAPSACVEEGYMLDVHMIHYLLAAVDDFSGLLETLREKVIQESRVNPEVEAWEVYRARVETAHRWDPPDVVFLKRMLQRELPPDFRMRVTRELFERYVSGDLEAFAREVYMTPDQARCMISCGMTFGNHTHGHGWLNWMTPEQQREEIQKGLSFLQRLGVPDENWIMNYPYGGYNSDTLTVLRSMSCGLGLSVNEGVADLSQDDPLQLPRVNTNDVPVEEDASAAVLKSLFGE